MPIIPLTILTHTIWVFGDSRATFTVLGSDEAHRLGIDWQRSRRRMMVAGDGSFMPIYTHDLVVHTMHGKSRLPWVSRDVLA